LHWRGSLLKGERADRGRLATDDLSDYDVPRVRRALAALPRLQRTLLRLKERGLSDAELGRAVGLTRDAAAEELARARRALRRVLEG